MAALRTLVIRHAGRLAQEAAPEAGMAETEIGSIESVLRVETGGVLTEVNASYLSIIRAANKGIIPNFRDLIVTP